MKLDLKQIFRELDGQPIRERPDSDEPLTLQTILMTVVQRPAEDNARQPGTATRPCRFAQMFYREAEVDLPADDLAFLVRRTEAVGFPPLVAGQAFDMLNGRSEPV